MTADVRGVGVVVRNLQSLNEDIEAAARKAAMRAAFEIESEAVSRVPVDTGRLKGSIGTNEAGNIIEVGAGVREGSEIEYAHFVEFGTRNMAAQPYLQPAVEAVRAKYPDMVIEDVRAEMR